MRLGLLRPKNRVKHFDAGILRLTFLRPGAREDIREKMVFKARIRTGQHWSTLGGSRRSRLGRTARPISHLTRKEAQ